LIMLFEPNGDSISQYLSERFEKHGPPLFFKRDNAGNFNCSRVDALLEKHMVIPLNSPCYYAPYNGGIEHAQGELKSYLKDIESKTVHELIFEVKRGIHSLNHKPRRALKRKNACQTYFSSNRQTYDKRKRRQIFDWIKELAIEKSDKTGMDKISSSAWRYACRKWMEENGVITVKKQRKVLPDFPLNFCQN